MIISAAPMPSDRRYVNAVIIRIQAIAVIGELDSFEYTQVGRSPSSLVSYIDECVKSVARRVTRGRLASASGLSHR